MLLGKGTSVAGSVAAVGILSLMQGMVADIRAPCNSARIVELLTDRQRLRNLGPRLVEIVSDDAKTSRTRTSVLQLIRKHGL